VANGWADSYENPSGQNICTYCDDNYDYCMECETRTLTANMTEIAGGGAVCDFCLGEYSLCGVCEMRDTNMVDLGGRPHCGECARSRVEARLRECYDCTCADHEEQLPGLCDMAPTVNPFGINARRWACSTCGTSHRGLSAIGGDGRTRARFILERPNTFTCATCLEGGSPVSTVAPYQILNYSHKPQPQYKRTKRDLEERTLHFGTEVEVEMNSDREERHPALSIIAEADAKHSLFYCKSDSTIRNGFEIVSHPFSCDWMHSNPDAFDAIFNLRKIMKGWEATNCGMHIHMSSDAFTGLHITKFMRFFYSNPEFIALVSRRTPDTLERQARLVPPEKGAVKRYALKRASNVGLSRGTALHPNNRGSIECRVFRSTLAPVAYYGNIEFLQALFDYTKGCSVQDLSPEHLLTYAYDRAQAYKNFITLYETLRPTAVEEEA
jgi:hypothetical protein